MPSQIVNFPESTSSTGSKTITIPNLKSVTRVTANTGTATYSVSGNNITINVSGGTHSRTGTGSSTASRYEYAYIQGGINYSFPATTNYNNGEYSGTLYKTGSPEFSHGTYTPGASKTASSSIGQTGCASWSCSSGSWVANGSTSFPSYPSTQSYNDGTYSGTLSFSSISGAYGSSKPSGSCSVGQTTSTCTGYRSVNYSGTVYKPESDTRVYSQKYEGYVYGPTSYYTIYYYAYDVTVEYEVHVAPDAPTIQSPIAGVQWFGINSIVYTGNDLDTPAEQLRYQIHYSGDNGATWSDIINLTAAGVTSYAYDFSQKPTTTVAKIRIRSYDGLNYSSFAYTGTFSIVHKSKIGEYRISKGGTNVVLPIYDPSIGMSGRDQLRTKLNNKVGCFELVPTTDPNASPVRVQTASGTKAILKG